MPEEHYSIIAPAKVDSAVCFFSHHKKNLTMNRASQTFTFIDELLQRSRKHMNSVEFRKFIEFMGKFPAYAYFNRMLVYLQNPEVSLFGSHTFWEKYFNRRITENARPYIVLVPFGPVGLVFDIMDTEGQTSPEELLNEVTNGGPFSVTGDFTQEQLDAIINEVNQWGIEVSFIPTNYFHAGIAKRIENGKIKIGLNKNLNPAVNFGTLLHELGHIFAGHLGGMRLSNKNKDNNQENQQNQKKKVKKEHVNICCHFISKDAAEIEAETISWLICKRFGIGTKSAEYLAGYDLSDRVLGEISYELMVKATDTIFQLFCKEVLSVKEKMEIKPDRHPVDIFF